jgi:hypothetical protein
VAVLRVGVLVARVIGARSRGADLHVEPSAAGVEVLAAPLTCRAQEVFGDEIGGEFDDQMCNFDE